MTSLLVRNATVLVTMDEERREIAGGGFLAEDGVITRVGVASDLPPTADEVVDLTDHVVAPGLVNAHHHFSQTLTRVVPGAQDAGLFDWLRTLYPIWARLEPDDIAAATRTAVAELALTGTTTAFDHTYLYPNGASIDDQVEGARSMGVRLHLARGSMTLGESDGGLPPDSVCEQTDDVLAATERAVAAHHDPTPGAMVRVVSAPCSPFSVTDGLMREAADQARDLGVRLHTHLAETHDETAYCLDTHGVRPLRLVERQGWLRDDAWFAHCVHLSPDEIEDLAAVSAGVAHCPTSNMRLGSGRAPVPEMVEAGVPVGLGVDGSASNDGSDMLAEVRQAMLVARFTGDAMPGARWALERGTLGSARVLGREDIGRIAPGARADFFAVSLDRPGLIGAEWDPVAAIVFAPVGTVDETWVEGRPVVRRRIPVTFDFGGIAAEHRQRTRRLFT